MELCSCAASVLQLCELKIGRKEKFICATLWFVAVYLQFMHMLRGEIMHEFQVLKFTDLLLEPVLISVMFSLQLLNNSLAYYHIFVRDFSQMIISRETLQVCLHSERSCKVKSKPVQRAHSVLPSLGEAQEVLWNIPNSMNNNCWKTDPNLPLKLHKLSDVGRK